MYHELEEVFGILKSSFETLIQKSKNEKLCIPSLSDPFHPSSTRNSFRCDPMVAKEADLVIAAAHQLISVLSPPAMTLMSLADQHFCTAALRVCLDCNVAEILREAGPEGLHVNDIAKISGVDPGKLARLIRLLAVHHVFREISPDVFANNYISSAMDTGKSAASIRADPAHKHDGTTGIAALLELRAAEGPPCSLVLLDTMKDEKTAFSNGPHHALFPKAMGVEETIFQFYKRPEQEYRLRRFHIAMQGWAHILIEDDRVSKALDWESLPKEAIVVDVGGGIGSISRQLARKYPHLKLVVQDTPEVVEQGLESCRIDMAQKLDEGRIIYEAHDFFTPQPARNVSVFYLKHILHNWSDKYALNILAKLREAASATTKLLITEALLRYACHEESDSDHVICAAYAEAPSPLLPNYGYANELSYLLDMIMMATMNSQERTLPQMIALLKTAGWKVVTVDRGNHISHVLAIPIDC